MFRKGVFILDSSGNRIVQGAVAINPVPGSGITLISNGHKTQLVEENQIYAITSVDAFWVFSITGETSVTANVEWMCAAGKTIIIKIPEGKTILYYNASTTTTRAYIRKLA